MTIDVLIVDDEAPIVGVLTMALRARGYAVRTSATAQDAILALAESTPNVMLLDINLPDLTGWELLRRLSPSERENLPVIAFSAAPLAPARVAEFKPAGVLTKPFPMDALLRLLEGVTGGEQSERSHASD